MTPLTASRSRLVPLLVGVAVVMGVGLGAAALTGRLEAEVRGESSVPAEGGAPTAAPGAPEAGGARADEPSGETGEETPRIAFLGDSLTVGIGAGPQRGFAWQTAEELGWPIAIVEGVSGSGFVAPGGGRPMPERVPAVVAADPDVVVVAGGTNDVFQGYRPDDVGRAAERLLTDLRTGLPSATLVVLGPFPPSFEAVGSPDPTRDAVRAAAESAGASFLDAGGIVAAAVHDQADWDRYISPDGLHPNELGYSVLADALAADLQVLVG
jgi:lysophospholipase L1-like esterase